MRADLDDALVRDFPALYRKRNGDPSETRMCHGFPGDGWEPLIRRMSEKLEPFCVATGAYAEQVKEKVGTLRISLDCTGELPEEIRAIVADAERESRVTCEGCGAAGAPRRLRWIRTLCAECTTFAEAWERRRRSSSPADEKWLEQFRGEGEKLLLFEDALRHWRVKERRQT
jgi:hypothetical protein